LSVTVRNCGSGGGGGVAAVKAEGRGGSKLLMSLGFVRCVSGTTNMLPTFNEPGVGIEAPTGPEIKVTVGTTLIPAATRNVMP
jgi:hypothetical protein